MNRICILSEQTIDQIAAGEVIENPASVVKELFENAVDAGASHITIETLAGGFQSIRISDDGSGMSDDDALLCLKRHATSKIRSVEDLMQLHTMGFRGEALASIAAISSLILTTSLQDGCGIQIHVKGGEILSVQPSARAKGTTIEIDALFYNVPARKKFQKTAVASSAEITRITTLLALAHPDVGVELFQQRKEIFSLQSSQNKIASIPLLQKRSAELLGGHFQSHMHTIDFHEKDFEMHGLLGDPRITRYNRSGQYLFINDRPVHCMPLGFAIRDAYGTRVDTARHPIYVIHAKIDPSLIDVNVHPQKKEVRLREEEAMKALMRTAVQRALQSLNNSPSLEIDVPSVSFYKSQTLFEEPICFSEAKAISPSISEKQTQFQLQEEIRAIGVFGQYLLLDAKGVPPYIFEQPMREGIMWIDLLAAEARILFERLMSSRKNEQSQGLLLPITFSCSKAEAEMLLDSLNELEQLGIQLRNIGPTVFIVEEVPACLEENRIHDILQEVASSLVGNRILSDEKTKRLAQTICQKSRSRTKIFSLPEALQVFKGLMNTCNPLHCPQGKSTFYHQKNDEIEHYFQS